MSKKFQELDLCNAFLFAVALEDPETCRIILEIILGHSIPEVVVHTEHNIMLSTEFKCVRLDVYAKDGFHVNYDMLYLSVPLTRLEKDCTVTLLRNSSISWGTWSKVRINMWRIYPRIPFAGFMGGCRKSNNGAEWRNAI